MDKNNKLYKLVLLIAILVVLNQRSSPQVIAPNCFSKEECKVSLKPGYCDVWYDCVLGQCKSQYYLCPEKCFGNKDEDKDGLIDCKDNDCYDSVDCPCERASYNECLNWQCSCPTGMKPKWLIYEEYNECRCA